MGYDLHITRAVWYSESGRFPILDAEVVAAVEAADDLVTPGDAPRRPGFCYVVWSLSASNDEYLLFQDGMLSTKNPTEAFRRRMTELAARLDAWVVGQDGELYEWDGGQVEVRWRSREEYATRRRLISRAAKIPASEWMALAANQPDFATMTTVEANLPSGTRQIECPPVACWTGHPSGRSIPFFHDDYDDVVEVTHADELIERRMGELATVLGAEVQDPDAPADPNSACPCGKNTLAECVKAAQSTGEA
ncbi:hypothetical protein [Actinoplanes solisilvae]|uniref:hypothetical protein n=1 Tax=Actinoplanes solisilvae TaxID=2486853 RepID=UPI000FD7B2F0|nr:hypothetical protein [Actinoplanes solisilvae]